MDKLYCLVCSLGQFTIIFVTNFVWESDEAILSELCGLKKIKTHTLCWCLFRSDLIGPQSEEQHVYKPLVCHRFNKLSLVCLGNLICQERILKMWDLAGDTQLQALNWECWWLQVKQWCNYWKHQSIYNNPNNDWQVFIQQVWVLFWVWKFSSK